MNNLIQNLEQAANDSLNNITESASPYFYNLVHKQNGKDKAINLILSYAIKNKVSIDAAIALLETELA